MRQALCLAAVVAFAGAAAEGLALDSNALVGWGVVGPAQYDQGKFKNMCTVNLTPFVGLGRAFSLGGLGIAVRATDRLDTIDEFGVAVPFATYHHGIGVAQVGVEIQRNNFKKNFYYLGVGLSWGNRARATRGK
jgi:hypothetical protein